LAYPERIEESLTLSFPEIMEFISGWEVAPTYGKVAKTSKGPIPPSFLISECKVNTY